MTTAGDVRPPAGLYIHVPFCVAICPYCDFVVYAGRAARGEGSQVARFVGAVETELGMRADVLDARWPVRPPLRSLYLGGGTPSLLPGEVLARLVELVRRRYGLEDGPEVTLEANPGADERGDAGAMRAAGVTRVSIGAQSMNAGELRALGRRHSPLDVGDAVRAARAAGIQSISLDLLYDVPGQTVASWARSLDDALALEPDHLSLYALTLDDPDAEGITGLTGDHLPLRRGARRWRTDARRRQDDDRAAEMYAVADARLAAAGYQWYEISNWARPGHESRHNLGYWRGESWEAAGPGAHAFDGATRRWNAARLDGYLAALLPAGGRTPQLPPGGREPVGGDDADVVAETGAEFPHSSHVREHAMLALRTREGLPASALEDARLAPALGWVTSHGLLEQAGDRLVLTLRGRLLSNEVFARLL